jgi:signal transduction histidine kinase
VACRALREGLVLPYVALEQDGESEPMAASGTPTPHTRGFEIAATADVPATRLVVGLRPGDLRLSVADATVLRAALPLVAQTLRAQQTAEQLRRAQKRTLTAVAEERRRLRRELHDGLGPRLSGIAFSVDAVANLTQADSPASNQLLGTVRSEVGEALNDLRRLVYGLRPPDLDQLGLLGAIRQQGELLLAGDRHLVVHIDDQSDLESRRPLPAVVEVAAYRIVVEALTNVARHTDSPTASVVITRDDRILELRVTDAGAGTEPWSPGVGIASMTERAAEIGGTLSAGPTGSCGQVVARLPLTVSG